MARTLEFLSLPPHQRMPADLERHFDVTTPALGQAAVELVVAFLLAALALVASVVLTARKRSRLARQDLSGSAPTPRTTVLVVLVCTAAVVVMETRTGPLVLESATPIPMTHTFANASLGIPPPVGLRGVGCAGDGCGGRRCGAFASLLGCGPRSGDAHGPFHPERCTGASASRAR